MNNVRHFILVVAVVTLTACNGLGGGTKPTEYIAPDPKAAEINVRLGLNYLQRGDYDIALEKLQKALKQDPNLPSAHNTIALLYQRIDEMEKAEDHFQEAIKRAPEYSEALNNYGVFLCQQKRYEEAEKQFLEAVKNHLYSNAAQALENAGVCVSRIPNIEQAEKYFRQALQINPNLSKSLIQMARISYELNDYLQARAYIQRYHAISQWSSQALLLAIKTENKLNDQDAVASYKLLLSARFPDSDETQQVKKGSINMASVSDDEVQEIETTQSVGERLRIAREGKKYSVAEVAAQLRFTKDTILHLESQQWSKLHGRAYARGYFSSYVKFLGLPENEFLAAFNIDYKSTPSDLMQPQFNLNKKKAFPWMPVLFVVIAIVITGFAYLQWEQSQNLEQKNEEVQEQNEIPALPWEQTQEIKPDAFDDSVVEPMAAEALVDEVKEDLDSSSTEIDVENEPTLDANELELTPPEEANEIIDIISPETDEISTIDSLEKVALSASMLELYSLEDCWVEVSDIDNNVLLSKTIKANETISLSANSSLSVTLGSAAHVTVKFNDALFDTTPYTQGGVARFTLGSET